MALNFASGDPVDIFQWHRLDHRLTTSGQPTDEQLSRIAALGVEHIVNLGPHEHEKALADEAGQVRALGMAYWYIPVDFEAPAEADFVRFAEVMRETAGHQVHVHCIANLRVSAFLYRYQRDVLGLAEGTAHAVLDRLWRPGGAWARFVGHDDAEGQPTRYAGHHYEPEA